MLRTRLIAGTAAGIVLSAVFATLMTFIAGFETFIEPLRVNPGQPAPVSLRLPPATVHRGESAELTRVQRTVGRGTVLSEPETSELVRLYENSRRPPELGGMVGLWFVYFLIATMIVSYLRGFSPSRGALLRTQVGLLASVFVLLLMAKAYLLFTSLSSYAIPVGSMALWVALYLDRRTAFVISIALSFLTASLLDFSLSAVAVFLVAGLTSTAAFRDVKHSSAILIAGAASAAACAVTVIAARTFFDGAFDASQDLTSVLTSDIVGAAAGGLLGALMALALETFLVLAFGAVSRARLQDLTDLDQPLLQKMAREAPGSWEHSRAMANLAEAAAAAVHADSLLTRVGAYYHDLGKTIQAKYFIENLDPGEESPHAGLAPDVSADAIMAHVVEGTRILREGGIPEPVVEFAYTHHGTSVAEFFWHKCLDQGNPRKLTEDFFRYPGMRPRTKETAILMLIDSIEAAARTIDAPSRERFDELVQRVVFVKLKQGQLDECGLTLEDLRVMATRMTDTLCNVYHTRIKYPWQERKGPEPTLPSPTEETRPSEEER